MTDLDGTFSTADDIIIAGCVTTAEEAKTNMDNKVKRTKLNERCEEKHIVLNDEKNNNKKKQQKTKKKQKNIASSWETPGKLSQVPPRRYRLNGCDRYPELPVMVKN